MRTFIAIELPEEIKDTLARLQEQLKSSGANVKWAAPQNIHLTLKFLGEIDENKLDGVKQVIDEAVADKTSFQARISSLGAFPKIDFPRIIWVGIDLGDKETKSIAKDLEDGLTKINIPKEDRPFSSHVTLGRVRSNLNRERLVKGLKEAQGKFGEKSLEFSVTKIILFKSTLTPKGPVYEILKEGALKIT